MQYCPSVTGKLGQLGCGKQPWAVARTHLAPLDGQRHRPHLVKCVHAPVEQPHPRCSGLAVSHSPVPPGLWSMTDLYHVRPSPSATWNWALPLCFFFFFFFLKILSFLYQFLSLNICQSPLVETIAFVNQRS